MDMDMEMEVISIVEFAVMMKLMTPASVRKGVEDNGVFVNSEIDVENDMRSREKFDDKLAEK